MGSFFNYFAVLDDHDAVGIAHVEKPVAMTNTVRSP